MPQCLVIAPNYADLSVLQKVLAELGFTATATTRLLVGAELATVSLNEFSFAVAVLPVSGPDRAPAMPATIFLEAGIVLGRGMPLIILAEDPDEGLPALGGLASDVWTIAGAINEANIRLQLTLFIKTLEVRRPARDSVTRRVPDAAPGIAPSDETTGRRGANLEEEVVDLLRAAGAQVELGAGSGDGDRAGAAALIPGAERSLGPVLIEVKALPGHDLPAAVGQLATMLGRYGAMVGLLVYDGPVQEPGPLGGFPIAALHIDQLREEVRQGSLGSTLIYIRNTAVHGLQR